MLPYVYGKQVFKEEINEIIKMPDSSETKEKLCSFIRNAKTLSMGEECKKFEEAFSKFQNRKYWINYFN